MLNQIQRNFILDGSQAFCLNFWQACYFCFCIPCHQKVKMDFLMPYTSPHSQLGDYILVAMFTVFFSPPSQICNRTKLKFSWGQEQMYFIDYTTFWKNVLSLKLIFTHFSLLDKHTNRHSMNFFWLQYLVLNANPLHLDFSGVTIS